MPSKKRKNSLISNNKIADHKTLREKSKSTSPTFKNQRKNIMSVDRILLSKSTIENSLMKPQRMLNEGIFKKEINKISQNMLPNIKKKKQFSAHSFQSSPRDSNQSLKFKTDKEIHKNLQKMENNQSERYKILKKFISKH